MPGTPTSPAKIPAPVTQDFQDWFSAQSCPLHSKVDKNQEKEITSTSPKKPTKLKQKQTPKQTKAL